MFVFIKYILLVFVHCKLMVLQNGRLEFDDELDPFEGKTEAEIQEIQAEKEAKANAQILEMVKLYSL